MKLAPSFFFIFTEIWLQMLPPAIPGDLTLYERLLSAGSKGSDLCWAQFETTVLLNHLILRIKNYYHYFM